MDDELDLAVQKKIDNADRRRLATAYLKCLYKNSERPQTYGKELYLLQLEQELKVENALWNLEKNNGDVFGVQRSVIKNRMFTQNPLSQIFQSPKAQEMIQNPRYNYVQEALAFEESRNDYEEEKARKQEEFLKKDVGDIVEKIKSELSLENQMVMAQNKKLNDELEEIKTEYRKMQQAMQVKENTIEYLNRVLEFERHKETHHPRFDIDSDGIAKVLPKNPYEAEPEFSDEFNSYKEMELDAEEESLYKHEKSHHSSSLPRLNSRYDSVSDYRRSVDTEVLPQTTVANQDRSMRLYY